MSRLDIEDCSPAIHHFLSSIGRHSHSDMAMMAPDRGGGTSRIIREICIASGAVSDEATSIEFQLMKADISRVSPDQISS